ncbi:unnamed protein product, partial [Heterosigma akashiwo]
DEGLRRVAAEGRPHGISLLEYLKFEIIGASVQPDRGEKVEQDLANFAAVPRRLEPLLAYGTAICTDTFLSRRDLPAAAVPGLAVPAGAPPAGPPRRGPARPGGGLVGAAG